MSKIWFVSKRWFIEMGSPPLFYKWSSKILPWLYIVSIITLGVGLYWGLFYAPADYKQGDVYRIIFIHVPSAILGQSIFMFMAVCGFINMIWRAKISGMMLKSAASIGASFTLLALITGSIWGKPTWGTWWAWDARITSMLILALFYAMYLISWRIFENKEKVFKISTLITILGIINVPIIKYSVDWWNTLHQPATINILSKSSIHSSMLFPLIIMTAAFALFSLLIFLMKYNTELIKIKNKGLDRL